MTGYMAKFPFLHFVKLSKNPLFLFLVGHIYHETSSFARSLAARSHALKLASLTFKNL